MRSQIVKISQEGTKRAVPPIGQSCEAQFFGHGLDQLRRGLSDLSEVNWVIVTDLFFFGYMWILSSAPLWKYGLTSTAM